MAQVHRICASCGRDVPLEAQYCPHCGNDSRTGLPMRQASNLPMVVTKAALPVLATAGTLAARLVWRLLRARLQQTTSLALRRQPEAPLAPDEEKPITARTKRTLRIRTTWAVGDAQGLQRQGYTDQTIEFDD